MTGRLRTSAIYYWLSVPLPAQALGDRYQISRDVDFPVTKGVPRLSAANCYRNPKDAWGNAKLRALSSLVPTDALALPWVLPSLSWWKPGGAWTKVDRCPKMLIFSRFKATPQSVAALLSLDVERRFIGKDSTSYSAAWKKKHLNPKPNQGPTLALFHPSPFLIMNVDPLDARNGATIKHVRQRVRQQIIKTLPSSINPAAPNARGEKRSKPTWQVLAAIEQAKDGEMTKLFANVQATWRKVAGKVDATLSALIDQRQSPEPISWISSRELDALVEMALGAPGVVAGRALFRHLPNLFSFNEDHYLRLLRFCWTQLRTYLDRPVFWSVLDEHFWLRKSKVNSDGLIEDLAKALAVNVGNFGFRGTKKSDRVRIRCHVAVPFGGTESEKQRQGVLSEEAAPARSEEIREAFNTPFWPFVLATTSVGQEGLDFHSWCDSLGHWDLCSNPVDLEQREGRIQRYGGLSVRQPLARELGVAALTEARGRKSSPWQIIADRADKDYGDASGMSPWWTMPGAEIKRHLFALPQSRDIDGFARLRSQRLLYRLALGQPDQEDLVELLTNHDAETGAALADLTLNLSAISHRKVSTTAPHPPAASQASRVPARVSG